MAPRTRITPTTLQTELLNLPTLYKDLPYEGLTDRFEADGYKLFLLESNAVPSYAGGTLVSFDVMVGKGEDALERFDQVTILTNASPGPVSMAARVMARESVIFLLTGRLPPNVVAKVASPAPAPEQNLDMSHGTADVKLPGEAPIVDSTGAGGEYVEDERPRVRLIEYTEPDGLPIFRDLYEIGVPEVRDTRELMDAVLEDVGVFLNEASSIEQINAFATKNAEVLDFVKDIGKEQDIKTLLSMVEKRRNELNRPAAAQPRRRQPAAPRVN